MTKKDDVSQMFYRWNKQLHLYFGVFICPFLLIFAISTIMLNHRIRITPNESVRTVPMVIPEDVLEKVTDHDVMAGLSPEQKAAGRKALVHFICDELDLRGEVLGFGAVRNNQTGIAVMRPGRMTRVSVNVVKQEAEVTVRLHGMFDTMRFLHVNPGPHKHPNWIGTKAWGWIADTTVYLTLFLTVSGIHLWFVIRAERKTGLVVLGTGCVSFVAIAYALLFI